MQSKDGPLVGPGQASRLLAFCGFALFLAAADFVVWGRAFGGPGAHGTLSSEDIRLYYTIPNVLTLGAVLVGAPLLARRFTRLTFALGAVLGSAALAASIVVLGFACLGGATGAFVLVAAAVLAGLGVGLSHIVWQEALLEVYGHDLASVVLGACIVFPLVGLAGLSLPRPLEFAFMALAVVACVVFLLVSARSSRPEPAAGPGLRETLREWAPTMMCLAPLGFVTGISRTMTLGAVASSTTLIVESLICILLVAVLLGAIRRVRGLAVSPVSLYRVAFPLVATGLVAFALTTSDFTGLFAGLSYFFFEFALIVVVMHNAQATKDDPASAPVAYGLVVGVSYLALVVGTSTGCAMQALASPAGAPVFPIAIVACIYVLSLPLLAQARGAAAGSAVPTPAPVPAPQPAPAEPSAPEASPEPSQVMRGAVEARVAELALRHALTPREAEVLTLVLLGYDAPAIAERLVLSLNTVRTHRKNLYRKLGIHSKQELVQSLLLHDPAAGTDPAGSET